MNEIKRFRDGSYDFFSMLPESVVLHILSFLPYKDIARTSALSKTWKHIWINCPNIDLRIHDYRFGSSLIPQVYLGHAGQALCQCLNRKACIQKFRLCISAESTIKDASVLKYLDAAMDIIFDILFEKNVSELAIEMCFAPTVWFSIPEKVVVAHCLKVLELVGCTLENRVACIDLPNLQNLKIHRCQFASENILAQILCGCPGVESVEVSCSDGMGSFLLVSCKPRLKYFSIDGGFELKRIEICVPSLETLRCQLMPFHPCAIELPTGTTLKLLEIVGVNLSGDCTIQSVLAKPNCIEELKLWDCEGDEKFQISGSCLKRLVMGGIGHFPGAELDTPNLLSINFRSVFRFHRSNRFSYWKAPKVEELEMVFGAKTFQTACRGGLKGFLMQLPIYKDLKLLVEFQYMRKLIMHEKVHAVSFSSLNKFVKKMKPEYVVISSRLDETFSGHILGYARFFVSMTMSLICSSPGALKVVHKKLLNDSKLKKRYLDFDFRAESIDHEIEHENGSAWESFMNTHSIGNYTATIIVIEKPFEEWVKRP